MDHDRDELLQALIAGNYFPKEEEGGFCICVLQGMGTDKTLIFTPSLPVH